MATKKEVMQKANDAYINFISLCKLFFGKEPIKKINQLDETSPFYKSALEIVKDCEYDWDNLSASESDEVMMIMLDEAFNSVNVDDSFEFTATVTVKERKSDSNK